MKKMYIEPESKIVTVDAEMALLNGSGGSSDPEVPTLSSFLTDTKSAQPLSSAL